MKDSADIFQEEVYFYLPGKEFLQHKTEKFSGILLTEDWYVNNSKKYFFKNGKYALLTIENNRSLNRISSPTCYYLNSYLCNVDNAGNYYNCNLISSEFLGCFDENGNDKEISWIDPSDGAPGVVYEDEYEAVATWNWNIYTYVSAQVNSNEQVKGKKNPGSPQGGRFTSIKHLGSFIVGVISYYGWTETSCEVSANNQTATAHVNGKFA